MIFRGGVQATEFWRVYHAFRRHHLRGSPLALQRLHELLYAYGNASATGIINKRRRWDFPGSFHFVGTIVSTIGKTCSAIPVTSRPYPRRNTHRGQWDSCRTEFYASRLFDSLQCHEKKIDFQGNNPADFVPRSGLLTSVKAKFFFVTIIVINMQLLLYLGKNYLIYII